MLINTRSMHDDEMKTKYYIFTCCYPVCKEIIPVEFKGTRKNSSDGVFNLDKDNRTGELSDGIADIEVTCPFCHHINHFHIKESIREISHHEYESGMKLTYAKMTLMDVIHRALSRSDDGVDIQKLNESIR